MNGIHPPARFAKSRRTRYFLGMQVNSTFLPAGIILLLVCARPTRADEVDMQNGDRYFGRVLSVSADTVVLDSEMLGRVNVPRKKVAGLAFGTNAAPNAVKQVSPSLLTNSPAANPPPALAANNTDFPAALRRLGANTNFIDQIRRQLLAGNPDATSNYDDLVSGLMNGSVSMDDLRRQAQASADQLREMKRELGPDAGASLDAYLEVLDNFLNESAPAPTNATPAPKTQGP